MCVWDWLKSLWTGLLVYEFHYDYIKNKSKNSRLLFNYTDNLMYEIKTEDVNENYNMNKEMFDFSNYSLKSNIAMIQTN